MQHNMMGNNIIITEPSSNLRALGRNTLAGKWKVAITAAVVYTLCLQIPPAILDSLFGINLGDYYISGYDASYNMGIYTYNDIYNSMPTYSPLSGIYTLLVAGPLTLGITLFFLAMFRRQLVRVGDIFLGFEKFGKAIGLLLFQGLFIALWTLLFIVPGIIAAIKYSQAFYILADDPNKSIRQCMNESKMMMKGNKSKFFCLNISFIGWIILASLPSGILSSIMGVMQLTGLASVILAIIGGLFTVPVTVYMYSTTAGFYEILAGHLIKETEPAPIDSEIIDPVPQDQDMDKAQVQPEDTAETQDSTITEKPFENFDELGFFGTTDKNDKNGEIK